MQMEIALMVVESMDLEEDGWYKEISNTMEVQGELPVENVVERIDFQQNEIEDKLMRRNGEESNNEQNDDDSSDDDLSEFEEEGEVNEAIIEVDNVGKHKEVEKVITKIDNPLFKKLKGMRAKNQMVEKNRGRRVALVRKDNIQNIQKTNVGGSQESSSRNLFDFSTNNASFGGGMYIRKGNYGVLDKLPPKPPDLDSEIRRIMGENNVHKLFSLREKKEEARMGQKNKIPKDARVFSRGIWVLWDDHEAKVEILKSCRQAVHMQVTIKRLDKSFKYTSVYASPNRGDMDLLWDILCNIVDEGDVPGVVEERIDKYLCNAEWQNLFRNAMLLGYEMTALKMWLEVRREVELIRKKRILARLKEIDEESEKNKWIGIDVLKKKLWREYKEILYQEENLWMQKRTNKVVMLKDDGGNWVEVDKELKNIAMSFYEESYSAEDIKEAFPLTGSFPKIDSSMLEDLGKRFSNQEIKEAIFSIGALKAPVWMV
ncbi:reverse transcriptase [Senna tora]|uniref:Reverse transcriptase n=1 Tax=Senna tora TaxID=362788 RepID=A0A834WVU8_9FABA|nr:reverse transcriptase [Senna tora]